MIPLYTKLISKQIVPDIDKAHSDFNKKITDYLQNKSPTLDGLIGALGITEQNTKELYKKQLKASFEKCLKDKKNQIFVQKLVLAATIVAVTISNLIKLSAMVLTIGGPLGIAVGGVGAAIAAKLSFSDIIDKVQVIREGEYKPQNKHLEKLDNVTALLSKRVTEIAKVFPQEKIIQSPEKTKATSQLSTPKKAQNDLSEIKKQIEGANKVTSRKAKKTKSRS